jgi:hypothetical protein
MLDRFMNWVMVVLLIVLLALCLLVTQCSAAEVSVTLKPMFAKTQFEVNNQNLVEIFAKEKMRVVPVVDVTWRPMNYVVCQASFVPPQNYQGIGVLDQLVSLNGSAFGPDTTSGSSAQQKINTSQFSWSESQFTCAVEMVSRNGVTLAPAIGGTVQRGIIALAGKDSKGQDTNAQVDYSNKTFDVGGVVIARNGPVRMELTALKRGNGSHVVLSARYSPTFIERCTMQVGYESDVSNFEVQGQPVKIRANGFTVGVRYEF